MSDWEKMKFMLLTLRDENEDAHGIGTCKTCGIEPEELSERFEKILHAERTRTLKEIEGRIIQRSGQWEGKTIEWIEGNKIAFRDILSVLKEKK